MMYTETFAHGVSTAGDIKSLYSNLSIAALGVWLGGGYVVLGSESAAHSYADRHTLAESIAIALGNERGSVQ